VNSLFPYPRTIIRAISPIDEGWYAGWASGMAASGLPVVIVFSSTAHYIATEYIFKHIAKLRHMTGGQATQSVVMWFGGSRRRGARVDSMWRSGAKASLPISGA